MIENVLILDTETTGLFPDKGDSIIEIAAVLFNVKHKTVLQCFSTLLPCVTNPVEKINHISAESTQCEYPFVSKKFLSVEEVRDIWNNPFSDETILYDEMVSYNYILSQMANSSQACIAHNAQFDRGFVKQLECGEHLLSKKWICTKRNFTWPVSLTRFRLEDICNAMGVSYLNAHRAMTDCLLIAQCFEKVEDLQVRINR